jgi:hypothetical protein
MTRVADVVDKFLDGVLAEAAVPASVRVESMGAFLPRPPGYTAPLVELTQRLAVGAIYARHVPRYLDLVLFERVLHSRDVTPLAMRRLGLPSDGAVARAARLVVIFLHGQACIPNVIVDALRERDQEAAGPTATDDHIMPGDPALSPGTDGKS